MTKTSKPKNLHSETVAVNAGRHPEDQFGFVNPPVYHASTMLYPTAESYRNHDQRYEYGSRGTPTSDALEEAIAQLENADGCRITSSGRSAIVLALLSTLRAGDHLLIVDNIYGPTRSIAEKFLPGIGVEVTFFDPLAGPELKALFQPNTKAVMLEAPGSKTFEMPDVPAIASMAKAHGALTIIDNTWATPLFFKPFDHGVDISIHSATKYIVGHADAMLGAVTGVGEGWKRVNYAFLLLRPNAGPDDIYLGQRGIRTMPVRLAHQMKAGIEMAKWLQDRPEVDRVLHPALESDPGHKIWKRDFTGASSLFSFVLKPASEEAVNAMLNSLSWFGMGDSWGGFESLIVPIDPSTDRTATKWTAAGPALRIHIGLENTADLKADLDQGFAALTASAR